MAIMIKSPQFNAEVWLCFSDFKEPPYFDIRIAGKSVGRGHMSKKQCTEFYKHFKHVKGTYNTLTRTRTK